MRNLNDQDLESVWQLRPLKKSLESMIKEARAHVARKVFLSHSHLDKDRLGRIQSLFEIYKADVYLDREDDSLPRITSVATAVGLRDAIDRCKCLVAASSSQLRESRWVPWEVGYADGKKGTHRVALCPIDRTGHGASIEQEYLDLYPRIGVERLNGVWNYVVQDPQDKKYWTLREWLDL